MFHGTYLPNSENFYVIDYLNKENEHASQATEICISGQLLNDAPFQRAIFRE